jgi:hypothetical protein
MHSLSLLSSNLEKEILKKHYQKNIPTTDLAETYSKDSFS